MGHGFVSLPALSAGCVAIQTIRPKESGLPSFKNIRLADEEVAKLEVQVREEADRGMLKLLRDAGLAAGKLELELREGDPGYVIPEYAREKGIDLVVMGTVGRSGIPGLLVGNTAERVFGQIECSMLAVKPEGFVSPIPLE
jgi:universal stress protein E